MQKLFVVGLVIAAMSAALAMPSMVGVTGGSFVPDDQVQQGVALTISDSLGEGGFEIPRTDLLVGVTSTLELGASYISWGDGNAWGLFGKFALPWTVSSGKLAASAGMWESDGDTNWVGALTGSWPVFETSTFTAGVQFNHEGGWDDNQTSYLAALVKTFENGTKLGLEYVFNMEDAATPGSDWEGDFGNAYIDFPINEMLTGRVALIGISEGTLVWGSVSAKLF